MKRPIQEKQHCHGVHICLIGANLFQNEMFIAALKQTYQCQNTFTTVASLSEIPEDISNKIDNKVIFYLDCFGLRHRELECLLDSSFQIIQTCHLLALFNLAKDSGFEKKALSYGVHGFFYPDDTPADICKGTRKILNGEYWLSRSMASEVIRASIRPPAQHCLHTEADTINLTAREKEVLSHLASGATNESIAAELYISGHTLRTHLNHIYRKLNVHTRMQAVRWAENHL